MESLKPYFEFYLKSSIHAALMVLCMYEISIIELQLLPKIELRMFVFSGTLFAYNFVKHNSFFLNKFKGSKPALKGVLILSCLSLISSGYFFIFLNFQEQVVAIIASFLFCLYIMPLYQKKINLRNIEGLKIHIVSLCWTLVSLILPLINSFDVLSLSTWVFIVQRYLWIILAILPFEIFDSQTDSQELGTIPQSLGVSKTKLLGVLLGLIIVLLSFLNSSDFWFVYLLMVVLYVYFLCTTSIHQSFYRNLFWVEAIPFFGLLFLHLY
ncbi:MAG: hypothetical protein P8N57_06395 [Flavobacteriaceae bacterium]|nr:hypothetical protein [Flavobacteriaceae bacterium]